MVGLASKLLQDYSYGDMSTHAAQVFNKGTKIQLLASGTPDGLARLTLRSSHGTGIAKAKLALADYLDHFPGLWSQVEKRDMPKSELRNLHDNVSVLVVTNTLFDRFESILDARPRELVRALLHHRSDMLAMLRKAEMENLKSEELRRGVQANPAVLEAKKKFLGFEKFRGKPGAVHINARECTVEIKGNSLQTVVANEYCRIGGLGYYELEILEMGEFYFGFVTRGFEKTAGRSDEGVGSDQHSWYVNGSGWKGHKGIRTAFGSTWSKGDVIGLGCDLEIGLLHVSVNGSFEAPNGITCPLSLTTPGLYPAFSAWSGKVRYNLKVPFLHPPPYIPVVIDELDPNKIQQFYMSMWECRAKAADVWVESDKIKRARKDLNCKRVAVEIMQRIEQVCPNEHSMEISFPDSRFKTPARIIVVVVDECVAMPVDDYRDAIDNIMGPMSMWGDRKAYATKYQAYLKKVRPIRNLLAAAKEKNPDCVLIPLLMPGWDELLQDGRVGHFDWWPEGLMDLKRHPLAVELLHDEDSWLDTIQDELVPKLNKYLAEWRGEESSMPEAICCPTCLKKNGGASPFCFDRDLCNRQLKQAEGLARRRLQHCPDCKEANLDPDTFELVKPQVYISHCADSHLPSENLLAGIYHCIESNVDCVCWPPQQKRCRHLRRHLRASAEKDNRSFIKHVSSMLVCLSDRYFRSETCLAEFREAIAQRRNIIPILMPDLGIIEARTPERGWGEGWSSGWQGSRSVDEWWKHPAFATLFETTQRGGSRALPAPRRSVMEGASEDGSMFLSHTLSRFIPISIEHENSGAFFSTNPSTAAEMLLTDTLTESRIIARVVENLHVSELIDHTPISPSL